MTAEWRRVEEVFLSALEHSAENRAAFVENACEDDARLQEEVEAMLRSHEQAGDFIEQPAYQMNAELLAEETGALTIGESFGEYRILSLLGEGGMGEVYLAEDATLGRKVALKLVKPGPGRANLIRHFRREEQILASLTHPNIARLYGGAVTSDGVPYFVMEYVEGQRLDRYCDAHRLTIRERLELFRKICSAVSYAHQHLVIHRDLKPANIRVTAEGEPKLLDFGIAKLLDDESAAGTEQTMTLTAATPEYASPEQLRGEAITTPSDVYSLGVILFELLTGTKPYRTKSRRFDEISRAIREQEPTKPSTALARGKSSIRLRRTEVRNSKLLRGDLDNIVLMAIRKEPARRYSSVSQLSEDIRRHLDGLPVIARKDTVGYRATKFFQRNRVAVSAAVLVVLAIVAGLIVSLWQAKQARAQRDVAQHISSFLQNMLGSAAPEVKGIDVKVSDLLNDASARARTELANEPGVMADVLMTLGRTYISLSLADKAEADLRTALAASLKANGERHPTTAATMGWLGLALAYRGQGVEGEQISRRAVELQRKLHPTGHEDLGVALYALGSNLIVKNQAKNAVPFLEEAIEVIRRHLGEKHGAYIATIVMLARAKENAGQIEAAEVLYRKAIDTGSRVEARYRIFLAQAQAYLGFLLTGKCAYDEAETVLRQSEATYRELYGGDANFSVAATQSQLALIHFLQGDYVRAESEGEKALDLCRKYFGPEHSVTQTTAVTLGLTLIRTGKPVEGEPLLREVLAIRKRILPPDNFAIPLTESALGECLTAQKRYAEAEPLLTDGYKGLKSKLGDQDVRTLEARQRLAKLDDVLRKPDQAMPDNY